MAHCIEMENITKSYDSFSLENISLKIPQGSIMGLIGRNGSGKTTLIKILLQITTPDSGYFTVFGKKADRGRKELKDIIGFMPDNNTFYNMFCPQQVDTVLKNMYHHWESTRFFDFLDRFEISRKTKISQLSMGMKQKLSLAVALSHQPKILLLDEPMNGLDPVARNELLDLLLEYIQDENNTILISSHITEHLEKIADYITFLQKGTVVFSRNKDALLEQYGVLKCSKQEYEEIDKEDYIGCRKNAFCCELLVADKYLAEKKYKGIFVDSASLEDIMLYYERGK